MACNCQVCDRIVRKARPTPNQNQNPQRLQFWQTVGYPHHGGRVPPNAADRVPS